MNLKRILVGAGLIVWAFLAFRVIPWVWVSIIGTYIILAFCSMTLAGFWNSAAWKLMFSGWGLWLLIAWASNTLTPSELERLGGGTAVPLIFAPVPWADWPYQLLGMTLTGLTCLVVWKMGESWHAKAHPEHFSQKYLNDLRDD